MNPATDPHPTARVLALPDRVPLAQGAERIRSALADAEPGPGLLRVEQPVEDMDPIAWVAASDACPRSCFGNRERSLVVAGLGVAASFDGPLDAARAWLSARLETDAGRALRVLLTCRFDEEPRAESPWTPFGSLRLQVPRVELTRSPDGTVLAAHATEGDHAETDRLLAAPRRGDQNATFTAVAVGEQPDFDRWAEAVRSVLAQDDGLQKCVLARTRTYALDGRADPFALLLALGRAQPDTCLFGLEVEPGTAFVAATPEVLFRRRERRVESEALAGTRWCRNAAGENDVSDELLASAKDQAEHAFVSSHVAHVLDPLLAGEPVLDGPHVRRVAELRHLDTRVSGELRPDVSDLDLLSALHPTPAVCGVPTERAYRTIRTHEPFDRGLYAGAIGLLGRAESVVAVGIRSALLSDGHATLFAGAGIVPGSDPEAEWEETGDKMRALDAILRAGRAG